MKIDLARALALDFLAGCVAFLATLLTAAALHTIHNLPFFLLGASALLFLVGYGRACATALNPWLNGTAVSLGASIPVLLLGTAVGFSPFGPRGGALVLFLAGVCGCGAQARSWWKAGRPLAASTISTALFAAVLLLGKFALPNLIASTTFKATNKPAPKFALTMLDGTPVTLGSLKGHVVVLDFWGTWCAPCLAELPTLLSIYDQYRGNPEVVFVLVNSGLNGDSPEKVRTFAESHHFRIPVALDDTHAAESLGAIVLPSLIVLDKQGNIRLQNSGYQGEDSLDGKLTQEVQLLLRGK